MTISRQVEYDTWDLTQLLCLIRDQLKAKENCLTPDSSFTRNLQNSYKDGEKFDAAYTCADLHVSQQAQKIVCVFLSR